MRTFNLRYHVIYNEWCYDPLCRSHIHITKQDCYWNIFKRHRHWLFILINDISLLPSDMLITERSLSEVCFTNINNAFASILHCFNAHQRPRVVKIFLHNQSPCTIPVPAHNQSPGTQPVSWHTTSLLLYNKFPDTLLYAWFPPS